VGVNDSLTKLFFAKNGEIVERKFRQIFVGMGFFEILESVVEFLFNSFFYLLVFFYFSFTFFNSFNIFLSILNTVLPLLPKSSRKDFNFFNCLVIKGFLYFGVVVSSKSFAHANEGKEIFL